MIAVTTFPPWAWDVYAKQAIESFLEYWPIPIVVYYESPPPLSDRRVGMRPLDSIPERAEFLEREVPEVKDYRYDAKRFCHKVFAQLETLKEYEKVIWLDADVVTFREIPIRTLEMLLDGAAVTYLGRNTYTETGFVGFNKSDPDFSEFEKKYREMYTKGKILALPYHTDCHAFDEARKGIAGKNLTPFGKGMQDVFNMSVLGQYAAHFKGPRKVQLYRGGAVGA